MVSNCLVATILSHRYNSRTGETKIEGHASSDTQPNQVALLLNTARSNPEASRTNVSEETPCTWQPWLARTAPGPPRESLVHDETRISLPAKPSLTRTMLGQLCVAPRTSRSRPVTTEPGREPRVSGSTAPLTTALGGPSGKILKQTTQALIESQVNYCYGIYKYISPRLQFLWLPLDVNSL